MASALNTAAAPVVRFPHGSRPALATLLTGQFMGLIDALIVTVVLPVIGKQLDASSLTLQLVVIGYVATYAVTLLVGGRLGGVIGHRRAFMIGLAVFTAASLACGLAPSAVLLVVARVVQGAGAGLMLPQVMSLIQLGFTGRDRARALSSYGVVLAAGAAVGLLAGGLVAGADLFGLSWRPAFLINVPIGIVLLVLSARYLPAERLPSSRGMRPLFDIGVLAIRRFRLGLIGMAAMQAGYGGFMFVYTLHLHTTTDAGAVQTAVTFLAIAIPFGAVGYGWRRLPARTWPRLPGIGLLVSAAAYVGAIVFQPETPAAIGSLVILGIGLGLTASPLMAQALSTIPTALVGDASAGLTTTVQLAQAGGVAAFGGLYGSLSASLFLGCVFAGCALLGALACILGLRAAKARTAP